MTREQYHENLAKKASVVLKTLREKNLGYNPTDGDDYDPFYNYGMGAELAGITQEQSMMARIGEKLVRLQNVIQNPQLSGSEAASETCKDIVGITLMLWESIESLSDEVEVTPSVINEELPLVSPELTQRSPILNSLLNWTKK